MGKTAIRVFGEGGADYALELEGDLETILDEYPKLQAVADVARRVVRCAHPGDQLIDLLSDALDAVDGSADENETGWGTGAAEGVMTKRGPIITLLEIRETGNAPPVMLWRDEYGTIFASPVRQGII